MTNELIEQAKNCQSVDELLALAEQNNIPMTAEEAEENFARLQGPAEGELSDDELDAAAGGACGKKKPKSEPSQKMVGKVVKLLSPCNKCGKKKMTILTYEYNGAYETYIFQCNNCGSIIPVYDHCSEFGPLFST